jgi:hypothetical protein
MSNMDVIVGRLFKYLFASGLSCLGTGLLQQCLPRHPAFFPDDPAAGWGLARTLIIKKVYTDKKKSFSFFFLCFV